MELAAGAQAAACRQQAGVGRSGAAAVARLKAGGLTAATSTLVTIMTMRSSSHNHTTWSSLKMAGVTVSCSSPDQ
eukprot:238570-Chlamydomonas_euryale.AAC.2